MSDMGKSHIVIMWTVGPDDVAAGDHLFESHGKWMTEHSREGATALLDYSISKGPELANPVDPDSAPTGDTIFVLDEFYRWPRRGRTLEAGEGELAGSAGFHGLDRQGQEGCHAAQRDDRPGPLVEERPGRGHRPPARPGADRVMSTVPSPVAITCRPPAAQLHEAVPSGLQY